MRAVEKNIEEEFAKKMVNDSLREFAAKLLIKISNSLNDRERKFVGIPLQCKMLQKTSNQQSATT